MKVFDKNNFEFRLGGRLYSMCEGELSVDGCVFETGSAVELYDLARVWARMSHDSEYDDDLRQYLSLYQGTLRP